MNIRVLTLTFFLHALFFVPGLTAAPGDLDLSFNPGLRVNDYVYACASQPDGKVIIGGLFTSPGTLLARLNTDGSVDTNFNAGTGANGIVYAMAVQTDGKIVVVGAFTSINGVSRNRVARLNADGSLDTSFDPGTGADSRIRAVALQSNGKILIAGNFFELNQIARTRVARLNTNGSVDTTFDPEAGADQEVYCIAVQPNGQVLIGGYFISVNDVPRSFIARLNSNGSVDQDFGAETGADLDVDAIAVQSNGKIIIAGGFNIIGGLSRNRIARLNSDGSVDDSFDPGVGVDIHAGTLALQTDGKIVIGGNFGSINNIPRSNIGRLNTDGSVDDTFDPGNGCDAAVYSLYVQDDKVLTGGAFRIVNGETRNYVARLNSNGAVDTEFNSSSGADYPVLSIAPDFAGRLFIGGYFSVINNQSRNHVARLNTDGTLDTSFNPGLGANDRVTCIIAEPDGKAIIGGLFTSFNGTNRGRIARLNSDGNLDLSFEPGTGANSEVLSIARQSDCAVIIAGEFASVNGTDRNRIARLNSNGGLDTLFDPGAGANLAVRSVVARPDGKVLIGGDFTTIDSTNRNRIARLHANGRVDNSFDPGLGANNTIESMALQPDGKILIAGQFTSINGTNRNRIARLNPDGGLDMTFSPGAAADGIVFSVAVQADGKILLVGDFFSFAGNTRIHIARLNTDGSLEASFNSGAKANDTVSFVTSDTDGNVLVGGYFNTLNGVGRSGIARLEGSLPLPALTITRADSILISWPSDFTNFTLQAATNFTQTTGWSDVTKTPVVVGNRFVFTNADALPKKFFRLKSL